MIPKSALSHESAHVYQYDGKAPFREVLEWCRINLGIKCWTNGHETIWISGEEAVVLFKLRWM
jgi:hypothetical protein